MDRQAALAHLPDAYATALTLHDRGHDDAIAERLGIAPEAVPALLELAAAKLARLISTEDRPIDQSPSAE